MLSTVDILIIAAVLLAVIATGLVFSRQGKDVDSYTRGNGHTPWFIAGISVFMSFFSAGTFIVWGSITYSHGLAGITIQEAICLAGVLATAFIARRWKRTGARTVAEYIGKRYGAGTGNAYVVLFFFLSVFSAGAFLYPVALILSDMTGLSVALCSAIIGALCLAGGVLGGLKAVVMSDMLKFVTLSIAILALVPLSLQKAGGLSALKAIGQENYLSPVSGEYTWLFMAAFCIYNTVQIGGNWSIVQKFNSVASERETRLAGITFSVLYFICPFLWMLPCMACRAIDGGASDPENAFIRISQEVLPNGLTGLMLISLIMTSASSINAMIHSAASVAANDLMRSIRPDASEKKLLASARISAILIGMAVVAIACITPKMGGIVSLVIGLAALVGAPVYIPLIWSLFSKTLTGRSMLASSLLAIAVSISGKYLYPLLTGRAYGRAVEMAVGVGAPILFLAITEIIHNTTNNNQLKTNLC